MERASVESLRASMEAAHVFTKAGFWFVAMPCKDEADYNAMVFVAKCKLEAMAVEMEKEEQTASVG